MKQEKLPPHVDAATLTKDVPMRVLAPLSILPLLAGLTFSCGQDSLVPTHPGAGGNSSPDTTQDLLLDDFEDGDTSSALFTDWYGYTDEGEGGGSRWTGLSGSENWVSASGYESKHAWGISYELIKNKYMWDPFIGVGFNVPSSVDLSEHQGISYMHRGAAHTLRVQTSDVQDYDYHAFSVPASSEWTLVTVPFSLLTQAGYGKPVSWDPRRITALTWHISGPDGSQGTFELDSIYARKELTINKGPADLTIYPASPPEARKLTTLEIPGTLQAKAWSQLNRGYNLTNWLESERFSGFKYDEAWVKKLSQAGFRALRLPIDFDLYITKQSGTGNSLQLELHEDLFTILDSFAKWTAKYGLSLTIDYHQYDASLDLEDPASVDQAVALWRAVARHFASNPREDLYYELLNEPELSVGSKVEISPGPWRTAAARMIEAIRAEDQKRTIIYGDVNWYGIDQLVKSEPWEDDNIVYAFHFYEPFIFTHQGADWSDMASTRQIPYPYSPERWSQHSFDFGFSKEQPAWHWEQLDNYYRAGTRNALWNQIAKAKEWGVRHGVPVICNEFGAYARSAPEGDRLRYTADLISIFTELQIPWQHWFMVLDEAGKLPDSYREAFQLE